MQKDKKLEFFKPNLESEIRIPLVPDSVSAGFPSPASDFLETFIDLNKELCKNPLATFYVKVKGNSMIDAGIEDKDLLIVDRSLEPGNNKIAICFIDGDFTVKRIQIKKESGANSILNELVLFEGIVSKEKLALASTTSSQANILMRFLRTRETV